MSPYVFAILKIPQNRFTSATDKIAYIKQSVSEYTGIQVPKLESKSRKRELVEARQMAMWLIKKHCTYSLKTIGESFGRDHTTVIHSINTVNDLIKTDYAHLEDTIKRIERRYLDSSSIFAALSNAVA